MNNANNPLLSVRGYGVDFLVDGKWIPAVIDMNLDLNPGEVLAFVGESGSGKSSAALGFMGLLSPNARVTGSIKLNGKELAGASSKELNRYRGKDVAISAPLPGDRAHQAIRRLRRSGADVRAEEAMSPGSARHSPGHG